MFKAGEAVIYGSQGVCMVTGTIERLFNNNTVSYYELTPVYQKESKIFVPLDNERLVGKIKKVLSRDEVYEIINTLPEDNVDWLENDNERSQKFHDVVTSGDRKSLASLIASFYKRRRQLNDIGKKLYKTDERIFREAEKLLYDEFAFVLEIKSEQVLPLILKMKNNDAASSAE